VAVTAEVGVTLVATNTEDADLATQFVGKAETEAADIATGAARVATDVAMLATATPTVSATPTASGTPDLTATALVDACYAEFDDLVECLNDIALGHIFADVVPDHRVVDNTDPTTLYRSEEVLALLNEDGVRLNHNNYTRPENCPLAVACVLHVLLISFVSPEAAQSFFDLVTATGAPDETEIPVPNADLWDDSKCARHTRPSAAEGAPPFAVIYCSVTLGLLHFGFNLSAYENLPDLFTDLALQSILNDVFRVMSVQQA
jgi:hypothetical protein